MTETVLATLLRASLLLPEPEPEEPDAAGAEEEWLPLALA